MTEREEEELREQIALAQQMLGAVTIMLDRLAGVLELEAAYLILKALKDGRLVAYNGGEPLPTEYWQDKTAAALGHIKLSLRAEDVIRVFPAPKENDA